jgi:DNA-binding response OmpR family regulator
MSVILVIEDDPAILRGLADNLKFESYEVRTATNGEDGLAAIRQHPPDLLILDLMLPKLSGYEVCRKLRAEGSALPILMLTARGEEAARVLGLDLGADDYMVKPFSVRELLARVRALLRRAQPGKPALPDELRFGDVVVDFRSYEARKGGKPLDLTRKEFGVLRFLGSRAGEVVARDELLNEVWGYETYPTTRTVDNHIASLRAKIETDPAVPEHLRTVHGVGYKFVTNILQDPGERSEDA